MLLVCVAPLAAHAQKNAFVDAFVTFHSRLNGTYGDEGPQIAAAVDAMAAGLAEWNREARATEDALKARSPAVPGDLALFYLDSGRTAEALRAVDAAIGAEPGRAAFHRLRALILERSGRHQDAVAALTTAWTIEPSDPITAYRLVDARRSIAAADDPDPQIAALMEAYARTRTAGPSMPFIEPALIQDRAARRPIFSPARYAEGLGLIPQGRYQDAIAAFRSALAQDPLVTDPVGRSAPMAAGIEALRAGRIPDAIRPLEAAVSANPDSSEAHRILGAAYSANRDDTRAVQHLEIAVRLAPGDERARLGLGRALMDGGRLDEAEQALRETIRVLPASAEARWVLADVHEKRGAWIEAIRELEAAASFLVLAGRHQLYWRRAQLCHHQQDNECVTVALAHRARLMPNEPYVHKELGLAYTRFGRPQQALVELLMATVLGLEDAETLAAIGQIHVDARRYPQAEEALRRALAVAPDLAQAHYALGTALVRMGRADEGKRHLTEFQRLRSDALKDQQQTFDDAIGGDAGRPAVPPGPGR